MTIRGDIEVYVSGKHDVSPKKAGEIVADALEAADDPNFAIAYAMYEGGGDEAMLHYWSVVRFLKDVVA